ncbi:MAG: hypothetical protein AAGC53_11030 [Actinomycetota bacterium]
MTTHVIAEFDALAARQFAELAAPGVWWTGAQKTGIAATARAAVAGDDGPGGLTPVSEEATRRIATDAVGIRRDDIERWIASGMRVEAYVELLGVTCRILALDTAAFGLGLDATHLPVPSNGDPSCALADDVAYVDGWVPTSGPAFPPTALSSVPGATELMFDIHGVLYLSLEQMGSHASERDGMSRAQLELTAARTSFLNECFY